jgi:sugar phosphate permease
MTRGTGARVVDKRWVLLIPVATVMYMLAFVDRTNISFVLPFMKSDLHLSAADEGFASGIFFVGYLVFQVPGAVLAQHWSAKRTVLLLMILWGVSAAACGLVDSKDQMYAVRFIMGVFEGGVQPATLVLLAKWFPLRERARANGFWLACLPLSAVIAAPMTGWLLEMFSWRMVFIVEGVLPIAWAIAWFFVVSDSPRQARWMDSGAAGQVETQLALDEQSKANTGSARYRDIFRNKKVWGLIAFWFLYNLAFNGFTLWLPTMIKTLNGGSAETIGWLTAIPYLLAFGGMIAISAISGRLTSPRRVIAAALTVSACALMIGQLIGNPVIQFVLLCLAAATFYIHGPFWALPATLLRAEVFAVVLGSVNGLGNLGGFFGPYAVGDLIDSTGSTVAGFALVAAAILASALIILKLVPGRKAAMRQQSVPTAANLPDGPGNTP